MPLNQRRTASDERAAFADHQQQQARASKAAVDAPCIDHFPVSLSASPAQLDRLDASLAGFRHTVQMRARGQSETADIQGAAARGVAGARSALPHLGRIQKAFGRHDVSHARASVGGPAASAARSIGAEAYAMADKVAFASAPSLHTAAHEAAHVVQQAAGLAPSGGVGSPGDRFERHADAVADAVVAGKSAEGLLDGMVGTSRVGSSAGTSAVQMFAPGHHRGATVEGLAGAFAPEEIGHIYASNWERDFAQSHPAVANVVLAWKTCELHAADHGGDLGDTGEAFRDAVWTLIDADLSDVIDEDEASLGGYDYFEHMDQPDEDTAWDANRRWGAKADGLPGYIADAKAYIKEQLMAAVDVGRMNSGQEAITGGIDAFDGVATPEGYIDPRTRRDDDGNPVSQTTTGSYSAPNTDSRDPVVEQTRRDAVTAQGAATSPTALSPGAARHMGHHLGRAMHAMEDFWAHSNWVELALAMSEGGATPGNADLVTGTFGMPAKAHALGHKLVALAEMLDSRFDLLLQAYDLDASFEPALNRADARPWWMLIDTQSEDLFDPLDRRSATPTGEFIDVAMFIDELEEGVQEGDHSVEDVLCNREFLAALKDKGNYMIALGDRESDEHSHGSLAKDQHEHGKAHELAKELAVAANRQVFAPLRAVMTMGDPMAAVEIVGQVLALVDALIAAPSPTHPLIGLVMEHHEHGHATGGEPEPPPETWMDRLSGAGNIPPDVF